jgi:hypothetical protein|uniref:Uncharacterized protein n=1 Tax=viral metagenome TaxID=1070528 RepID=A0A6C0CXV8_9ZZZZ
MAKLVELIIIAQNIPYIEPQSENMDEWTSDELVFKSIYIALNNPVQIKAGLHICNQFPPLKLIYKSILNQYIKYFSNRQQSLQSANL